MSTSSRKQPSDAFKRALQKQITLKAKRMKGSMKQYLVKNKDIVATGENNASRTENCDSDLQNNGTEYILQDENSEFMNNACESILNYATTTDEEKNSCSLENISISEVQINNESMLNITVDEENSCSLENISSDEMKININEDAVKKFSPDAGL